MKDVTVRVTAGRADYDVVIGAGLLERAPQLIAQVTRSTTVAIICDDTVAELYAMKLTTDLARAGFTVHPFTFPAGEQSKSWSVAGQLVEALASAGLGRHDAVIALGGGVTGDLAGFVAASYLRGVDFIQVPTTLLAQVDSSVGGKTGVDLSSGKNLAGAFKPPSLVLADIDVLSRLPEREWVSGLAEVAKSAVLDSQEFTTWLEQAAPALMRRSPEEVAEAVRRCVEFKARVVSSDELEQGARESLNYGHTVGHAIETAVGYGVMTHGACVAEGMRIVARVAVEVADASPEFVIRQDKLLDALGLPFTRPHVSTGKLLEIMRADKKVRSGQIRFVLVSEPGVWTCTAVDERTIEEHLLAWSGQTTKRDVP